MRIEIKTDNDAFSPSPEYETARILRDLADRIEKRGLPQSGEPYWLMDYNGNAVGECAGDEPEDSEPEDDD